jgi:hypothetical protein
MTILFVVNQFNKSFLLNSLFKTTRSKKYYNTTKTNSSQPFDNRKMLSVSDQPNRQDIFYFEKSNLAKQKPELHEKIPVILLLGWTGAIDKHLRKYQEIYSTMGYHVVRLSPSNTLTFLKRDIHKTYAYELLDLMKNDYKLDKNPIITHFFSNACIFILYHHIIREINQNGGSKAYNFFKDNHKSVIIDSGCGWPVQPLKLLGGISDLVKPQFSNPILRYMVSVGLVSLSTGYTLLNPRNNYFMKALRTVIEDDRPVPLLSYYSTVDKLISAKDIRNNIEERRKLHPNLKLTIVEYNDADHVLLYAKHPEHYIKTLYKHLKYCQVDVDSLLKNELVNNSIHQFKSKL